VTIASCGRSKRGSGGLKISNGCRFVKIHIFEKMRVWLKPVSLRRWWKKGLHRLLKKNQWFFIKSRRHTTTLNTNFWNSKNILDILDSKITNRNFSIFLGFSQFSTQRGNFDFFNLDALVQILKQLSRTIFWQPLGVLNKGTLAQDNWCREPRRWQSMTATGEGSKDPPWPCSGWRWCLTLNHYTSINNLN